MAMNPQVKALWVDALRSGKFKKTEGQLYDEDDGCYCALGVLAKIYSQVKKVSFINTIENGRNEYLTNSIVKWAGLQDHVNEDNDVVVGNSTISEKNDFGNNSFKKIASFIEKRL